MPAQIIYCPRCNHAISIPTNYCPYCNQPLYQSPPLPPPPPQLQPPSSSSSRKYYYSYDGLAFGIKILIIVIIALLFVLPSTRPYAFQALQQLEKYLYAGLEHYMELPDYAEFIVQRTLTVQNQGISPIPYNLTLHLPLYINFENTEVQKLVSEPIIDIEGVKPNFKERDGILEWTAVIGRGETHTYKITYHMIVTTIIWDLSPATVGSIDDIPEALKSAYIKNDWLQGDMDGDNRVDQYFEDVNRNGILDVGEDRDGDGNLDIDEDLDDDGKYDYRIYPDATPIRDLALRIAGDKTNVYQILEAIYNYMETHLTYPTPEQMQYDAYMHYNMPKTALETLKDGYGDCDDQALVFISLCRALGIPAWLESGALYDKHRNFWCGHGWVRVYLPLLNGGGEEAAGGGGTWANVDVVNKMFLKRDPNRFSDWVDDGSPNAIEEYYTLWQFLMHELPTEDKYIPKYYQAHESEIKLRV